MSKETIELRTDTYSGRLATSLKDGTISSNCSFNIEQYRNKNITFVVKAKSVTKEEFLQIINSMIESYESLK